MEIAGRKIGPEHPPYIIAEVSCNHGGDLGRAMELIDAAKSCGADAIKFQCFEADTITIDSDRPEFTIKDGPWKGENLFKLYRDVQTPFSWFPEIKARADKIGIAWFASVFDETSVALMERLDAPALKIASFEITDTPLIAVAAASGKPMIISTGMASYHEINAAMRALEPYEPNQHAFLHCISGYPSSAEEADLRRIQYGVRAGFVTGLSDHTMGPEIPIAATALGACIIEKHFRLFWHPDTEDSPFSLDETDFAFMCANVRNTWRALQRPPEKSSQDAHRSLRRSLFVVQDVRKGEVLTRANVRSIRPGHGMPPSNLDVVLGQVAARDLVRGEPLTMEAVGACPVD